MLMRAMLTSSPRHDHSEGYFEERGPAGKRTLAHRTAREFDVITNKYHVAHDARVAIDEHRTRADVSRKYWQTHSYDPLLAKFVDPARESSVQQHEEEHKRTWGKDADKKLPPCVSAPTPLDRLRRCKRVDLMSAPLLSTRRFDEAKGWPTTL